MGCAPLVVALAATSWLQTTLDGIRACLTSAADAVEDVQLTIETTGRAELGRRLVSVTLVGRPHWERWSVRRYDDTGARESGATTVFDGRRHAQLQLDGLGFVNLSSDPQAAYMSFAGIYVGNVGLGPGGSGDDWAGYFERNRVSVEDVAEHPGRVRLSAGRLVRELDAEYGFMPVHVWFSTATGENLVDLRFTGYARHGPIWLPERIENCGKEPYTLRLLSAQVNAGLQAADVALEFPYGTSVLYEDQTTRIAGEGGAGEAEAALNAWLVASGCFGRAQPTTAPVNGMVTVVAEDGESLAWSAVVAAFACGAAVWTFSEIRKRRQGAPRTADNR